MKKILCLALVLILTMSVAMTASAADATLPQIDLEQVGNMIGSIDFEIPKFSSLDEAFNAFADFLKFEAIMVYVNEFHVYMADFYKELNSVLKGFGVLIRPFITAIFSN